MRRVFAPYSSGGMHEAQIGVKKVMQRSSNLSINQEKAEARHKEDGLA
jgi:hypothetical protein